MSSQLCDDDANVDIGQHNSSAFKVTHDDDDADAGNMDIRTLANINSSAWILDFASPPPPIFLGKFFGRLSLYITGCAG